MEKMRIGFVGLGLMGSGMVRNLLRAGFPVIGFDLDAGKAESLAGQGFQKAENPADLAANVDVIMLSLPNSPVVNVVVADTLKLAETGRKGLVLIDTTTAEGDVDLEITDRVQVRR